MCGNTDKGTLHYEGLKRHQHGYRYSPCFYDPVKMSSLLLMVILATAMTVDAASSKKTMATPKPKPEITKKCFVDSVALSHQFESSDSMLQLVNASCSFSQALDYCQSHFSSLTVLAQPEDEEGTKELLAQAAIHQPVWVRIDNKLNTKSTQSASEHNVILSGLSFPAKSQDGYARMETSFPPLSAVTVCLHAQFGRHHEDVATLFSYAAPKLTNEFQLRGRVDKVKQQIHLALIIHGKHHSYKAWFPNSGSWHQICVTWQKSDGHWVIYVDGEQRDSSSDSGSSRDIYGSGIFILGQDQDSFGGNFTEPFVGNITEFNIWDVWLNQTQIQMLSICSPGMNLKPFFSWQERNLTLHTVVKEIALIMNCPGLQKQNKIQQDKCKVLQEFNYGAPRYRAEPCSETFLFICKTSKDRYLKKKELEKSLVDQPSPFMKHLLQHGMNTSDVFGAPGANKTWTSVLHLLNVSEHYVHKSKGQLEDRDLPSLVQMLSRAADLPATGNQSNMMAHKLSHSFIGLADTLISQENTKKWQNISEIVSGPMAVVQTIDRMASNLSPLLLEDTDHVQIHSNNISLQVHQTVVSESSQGSDFCVSGEANQTSLDCISVPAQSMQELHNKGFSKVTLLNAWYGSLTPLLNERENITLFPTITDSSHRYMGTVLGSSLISSAVIGDGQLVRLGVQFTLRHQIKSTLGNVQKPVCAFWDFNLMPENGGTWSTDGCVVTSSEQDSTSCYCNHTTNFALLLQIYDVQRTVEDDRGLQILSFIGCGVSLCGLIFTFILFIAVGVPKSDRTTVHKNLIVALAVAQFLLISSYWASENQDLCLVVTALLHLFFLSSFCWMLVEGLLLWSKVVSVNISEDRRMRFYYALGWGLPIIIVSVTLTVSLKKYKAEQHCWLNTDSDIIWAFVGPVLFVLTVNAVVLCRVIMVTVSSARRRAKMLAPSSDTKARPLDLTWAATRPVFILMPVLGLTWLCGILVHLSVVLAYLFIALNAFQGLYIFLVYAVYNSEVQNAIKRIQEKRKALSFTNCSQPVSFMPSQRTHGGSWAESLPTPSSPESSSSSYITNSTASSLVIKNESFRNDNFVTFSLKPSGRNSVVQLTSFKPSG
ncbi:adhesion G-protein coupled receptor D2 isoform X2 [Trichomycterus rosablanca]|uniref:adhesion G-protein coupled receptor D2 isoform X2 n=1 Tax=Trichomycterus rosablanca TaxID=2290929 RepID=UPI002F352C1D